METTAPSPNAIAIHSKMRLLKSKLGAIGKDRQITFGEKYNYRGIDDLYNALQVAQVEAGVMAYHLVEPGSLKIERGTNAKGNPVTMVSMLLRVIFVDVDTGSAFSVVVPAEGFDSSDKGTAKAVTAGMKSAWFHVLTIPTEDPDADRPEPAVAQFDKEGVAKIVAAFKSAQTEDDAKATWIGAGDLQRAPEVIKAKEDAKKRLAKTAVSQ